MTQQQYDAGQTIMQMCRIFSKAMRDCMENSGLLDEGYELHLNIWKEVDCGDAVLLNSIRLDPKEICTREEYDERSFGNHYYEKEGWIVINDPIIKSGTVPPTVRTVETAQRIFGSRKKESKPVAPDGLWISRFDDPYPVDCGV